MWRGRSRSRRLLRRLPEHPNGEPLPIAAAVAWLQSQQDAGGGFPGLDGNPDPGITVDAILALVASPGYDEAAVQKALAYLDGNAKPYIETGAGQAAKVVLAMAATGGDPTSVNGVNPVDLMESGINPDTGLCGSGVFDQAYCVLARVAIGKEAPVEWIDALRKTQSSNGGWAFDGSTDEAAADSNTTALVIEALVAAGVPATDDAIVNGIAFLKTLVVSTGGFAYGAVSVDPSATPVAGAAPALIAGRKFNRRRHSRTDCGRRRSDRARVGRSDRRLERIPERERSIPLYGQHAR